MVDATPAPEVKKKAQFFGYPSYAAYREAFRAGAKARHVDVEQGASSFQSVLIKAELNRQNHHTRAATALRENAVRCSPQTFYYYWDDADPRQQGRILLRKLRWVHWDNGRGGLDTVKLEQRTRRDWWEVYEFWDAKRCAVESHPTVSNIAAETMGFIPPPDQEALHNLRHACPRTVQLTLIPTSWEDRLVDQYANRLASTLSIEARKLLVMQPAIDTLRIMN